MNFFVVYLLVFCVFCIVCGLVVDAILQLSRQKPIDRKPTKHEMNVIKANSTLSRIMLSSVMASQVDYSSVQAELGSFLKRHWSKAG